MRQSSGAEKRLSYRRVDENRISLAIPTVFPHPEAAAEVKRIALNQHREGTLP
jgi:hypothetical protein